MELDLIFMFAFQHRLPIAVILTLIGFWILVLEAEDRDNK